MTRDKQIAEDIGAFQHNPLAYVLYAFPWGERELKGKQVRKWQRKFLERLGEWLRAGEINHWQAIQAATASGHGIGKTALVAWIILWCLSTYEDSRGIVTANTERQLRTKTWPELAKWLRLAINGSWFRYTATSIYSTNPKREKTWRFDAIPWSITNTEAFSGLHNEGRRVVVIFDEASSIPDPIWEVTQGALTDENTELIWLVFGNPTRNTGRFRQCFGRFRHRWDNNQIDSRDVDGTNKAEIAKLIEDFGEDSDIVRIRVRGRFPRASSLQFIASDLVAEAMKREARSYIGDPLIMSLDIARGGDDNNVFRFRRGFDAKAVPPVRIPGSETRDSMRLVSVAVDLADRHKPNAFFYDDVGVGGPVGDRVRQLGYVVIPVLGSGHSPDPHYLNMRAYMYAHCRDWLQAGGAIEDSIVLETDLTSIEYAHDKKNKLFLESKESMKKRGLASPDDGDALAMTFAFPVALTAGPGSSSAPQSIKAEYDPFDDSRR